MDALIALLVLACVIWRSDGEPGDATILISLGCIVVIGLRLASVFGLWPCDVKFCGG